MVPHPRLAALLITATASSAHAWDAFFRISFEITSRGTSGTTESSSDAASRSEREEARRQEQATQYSTNPQCRIDSDCALSQYCEQGRCVRPVASAPAPQARPIPGCADDSQCALGYACFEARCVERAQPRAPPVQAPQCTSDEHCMQGQSCVNGTCMSPPPFPPPSSSLERRGTELYLRERAAQLREDVALGGGPVLASLALEHKVTVRKLGLILRANRAELRHLVGDRADTTWPARFLDRVEQLLSPKLAATQRATTRGPG